MRKSVLFIVSIIFMGSFAGLQAKTHHYSDSKITVRSLNHQKIIVELDGRRINKYPRIEIEIPSVRSGYHRIRILKNQVLGGGQHHHGRKGHHVRQVVIADEGILMNRKTDLIALINKHNRLIIKTKIKYDKYGKNGRGKGKGGNSGYGNNIGWDDPYDYGNMNWNQDGRNGLIEMDKKGFSDLKYRLDQTHFESTKKSIIKSALSNHSILSRQLGILLKSLDFESSRKEIAKWAYPKVSNKQNIFKIYDAFAYESSIREMERFFASR